MIKCIFFSVYKVREKLHFFTLDTFCRFTFLIASMVMPVWFFSQNTAVASGDINNCATWGNPAKIFRNTSDKTINNGVTVTANENWSTGAVQLNGNGAINFNNGIVLDFTNSQGSDKTCGFILYCTEGFFYIFKDVSYVNLPVSIHYENGDGRTMPSGSQTNNGVTLTWAGGVFPVGTDGTVPFIISTPILCGNCSTPTGWHTFNVNFGGGLYCNISVMVQ
ncbi:hypothetical protein [Chryseobacterium taichungense]|uniref:hypothetical protein n=1 Tax=Chryseobacterium taichungense TaxID=295069 RepID=UPI0028B23134|nr:hypothetical protein [Chryseobacterium taichungense]